MADAHIQWEKMVEINLHNDNARAELSVLLP